MKSKSLQMAREFLGKEVTVTMDRPLGTKHPEWDFIYEVNYGFIPDTIAPDGEGLDAYVLGITEPVKEFFGTCIAVVHREDDDDDKLVIVPKGFKISDEEIMKKISFQEQWFKSSIQR